MRHADISDRVTKPVDKELHISAINQRLSLALESSRQVAFDWHIPDDRLFFSGALAGNLSNVLLDTTKIWQSSELPAIIHDEDKDHFRKRLHETLKGKFDDGAFCRVELRLKDAKCAWRWVEISGRIVERDSERRALRMAGTFSDIHERKQAENRAARQHKLYIALSQTAQAIVRTGDRDALFREICRIVVEYAGLQMAWIGLRHGGHVAPAAAYSSGADTLRDVAASLGKLDLDDNVAITRALNENRPIVCNDLRGAPDAEYCRVPLVHDRFLSAGSFPFRVMRQPAGTLNLYSAEANFFDPSVIGLLEEMMRDISFVLDNHERESRRQALEAELTDSEKLKSAILTAAPDCIVSIDDNGNIISYNQAAEHTFGYRSCDVLGKKLTDMLIAPEWRQEVQQEIELFFASGESRMLNRRIELTAMRAEGATFPVELAVVPLSLHNGPSFTAFIRDISEKKRAEALQLGQNRILNLIATDACLYDILIEIARFAEVQSGRATCSIFPIESNAARLSGPVAPGLPPSLVMRLKESVFSCSAPSADEAAAPAGPETITDIESAGVRGAWRAVALAHGLRAYASWPIFGKSRKKLGTFALYFREATAPTANELQVASICTSLASIAIERRSSDERMRYLAHYDGLTELPNRFLFKEYLELALRNARRSGKQFAVLFVDLDRFKEINDTLGHDAGDRVLREIAAHMRNCLRDTDKIARMGGDEFYVLVEELSESRHAGDIAEKLLAEASRPVHVCGEERCLSASIGISIYPDDGDNAQSLLRHADSAMYRAKRLGKDCYQFFSAAHQSSDAALPLNPPPVLGRHGDTMGLN